MKTIYSISIPKPCHEDWSKMTPNEKGRFCQSCSKTVVDFTKMNVNEIQDYIHNNKDKRICGHIKQSQLDSINLQIPSTVFKNIYDFQKLFLLTLLLAMGTTLLTCSDKNGNKKQIENIEIIEKTIDSSYLHQSQSIDTIEKIKSIDNNTIKRSNRVNEQIPSVPNIMGDMVAIDGIIEVTTHIDKEPYAYNYVDEKPKFFETPTTLTKIEEKEFFHQKISTLIHNNFKIEHNELGLKGKQRIYCQFEISKVGLIENLKIRAPHPAYESEVNRVFELFPKFIPAKYKGENVSVIFSLPIVFVIKD